MKIPSTLTLSWSNKNLFIYISSIYYRMIFVFILSHRFLLTDLWWKCRNFSCISISNKNNFFLCVFSFSDTFFHNSFPFLFHFLKTDWKLRWDFQIIISIKSCCMMCTPMGTFFAFSHFSFIFNVAE